MCLYLCSLMNSMDIYHCWARTEWWYAQISISKWKLPNSLGVRSLLVIVNVETLVQSLKARFIIRTSFMVPTNDSNACYVGNLYLSSLWDPLHWDISSILRSQTIFLLNSNLFLCVCSVYYMHLTSHSLLFISKNLGELSSLPISWHFWWL